MKTATFGIEASSILLEAERHYRSGAATDSPGMVMGIAGIRAALARIAQRAVDLKDEPLIAEMVHLGCLRAAGHPN